MSNTPPPPPPPLPPPPQQITVAAAAAAANAIAAAAAAAYFRSRQHLPALRSVHHLTTPAHLCRCMRAEERHYALLPSSNIINTNNNS
jgi:hypothetical protein